MADPYEYQILEHWNEITGMYLAFEEKQPIIEFNATRNLIIAYPAEEFINGLSDRTRDNTMQQYRKCTEDGALMVFVRDEVKKVLRSYIYPVADG